MEISPTRRSIGGDHFTKREFVLHELALPKGSILYLVTDGVFDQSNRQRARYGKSRFKHFLSKHASLPLGEQKVSFLKELEDFRQGEDSRDDITLLAVKI